MSRREGYAPEEIARVDLVHAGRLNALNEAEIKLADAVESSLAEEPPQRICSSAEPPGLAEANQDDAAQFNRELFHRTEP